MSDIADDLSEMAGDFDGSGMLATATLIRRGVGELRQLRAALRQIAEYPSLVPSEEHYRQFPDTKRFADFREIARHALGGK